MNYSQVIAGRLFGEPLFIEETRAAKWLAGTADAIPSAAASGKGLNANGDDKKMVIDSGIAVIPLDGVLMRRPNAIERYFGATSYSEFTDQLYQALGTPGIKGAIICVDSPGGTVCGCPEVADVVASVAAKMPVAVFSDGLVASAAYYATAAASGGLWGTSSSEWGCIGVIAQVNTFSEALKAMGVEANIFASGKFKSAGHPAQPMSDTGKEYFQGKVDRMGATFREFVMSHRRNVATGSLEGQTFWGQDAVNAGLVDGIVSGIHEVKKMLLSGQRMATTSATTAAAPMGQDWRAAGFSSAETYAVYLRGVESGTIKTGMPKKQGPASRADFSSDKAFNAYLQGVANGQIKE